ncbi:MAG: hypothetical protein R2713_19300 [Ilumatobacteraceae bacterium]
MACSSAATTATPWNRVELADPTASTFATGITTPSGSTPSGTMPTGTVDIGESPASTEPGAPPETFPPADPGAKNFLITGADNNACIDPDSPYAAAFGNREGMGERSDTIMIMRADPSTKRAAVPSFPRDLHGCRSPGAATRTGSTRPT